MRRALVLVLVCGAALLGTGPTSAAAREGPLFKPEFRLHADGFLVQLKVESDGKHVVLNLFRHGQSAYYETAAQITEDSVKAHFGSLCDLDYTFTPASTPGKGAECAGARAKTEGTFRGRFDFAGENDYVKFDIGQAHGSFEVFPSAECRKAPPLLRPKRDEELTLTATALRRDPESGTVHLDPPAPFQGSAELRHLRHERPVWRGSLRVPVLGGGTLHLTGGRFKVSMGHGSIIG